jgi:hypothetical protein
MTGLWSCGRWSGEQIAESVRKNVSAPLCVRALQIIRFGMPLLEAWHRGSCHAETKKGAVCGTVSSERQG